MKKNINYRFGVEIELNSFESNFDQEHLEPFGIRYAAEIVKNTINANVEVTAWHTTINSDRWITKPDSSCGIEICSPVLKGDAGLKSLTDVIKSIKKDGRFESNLNCSFHVHFELSSKDTSFISSLIVNWIRCELFFFLLVPNFRKENKYCQIIGMTDIFPEKIKLTKDLIFNKISEYKFYSLSLYHFKFSNRNTVEFRIMDNSACLDYELAENWILLLNKFINKSSKSEVFDKDGYLLNPLVWLDIKDVFDFLDIKNDKILFPFVKKRIKKLAKNKDDISFSILKKIFNVYLSESLNFLEI